MLKEERIVSDPFRLPPPMQGPGDGAALAAAAGVLFDDAPREEDAAALPAAVRAAVLEWAAGVRSSARPTSAAWHDGVAAELRSRAEGWRHALVLAERERHGPAASAHRLRSMRSSLRALALAELRAELWDATSLEDAEADAAAAAALERWSAAPTPADGDLGLEPGLWEGRPAREGEAQGKVGYAVNAAAAVAALGPLAGDGGGCTVPEDRLAAIRAASRAWGANGVPPPGMDALLPLLLWALARVHTPPAAPLRLASHVAFVMRFLDAEAYSAGGEEMWCASLLEMGLRAALAVAGWAPRRWRYHRSSPGWIDVPQTPADESSRVDDSE